MNDVEKIRDIFQKTRSPSLSRRRKIVGLSLLGAFNAGLMTLHQTGILKRLPDLPGPIFDANYVTLTPKAFEYKIPDGPLALTAYAVLTVLATFGGDRSVSRPAVLDKTLFGLAALNALAAYQYQFNMIFKQKRICIYCVSATIINTAIAAEGWKECRV